MQGVESDDFENFFGYAEEDEELGEDDESDFDYDDDDNDDVGDDGLLVAGQRLRNSGRSIAASWRGHGQSTSYQQSTKSNEPISAPGTDDPSTAAAADNEENNKKGGAKKKRHDRRPERIEQLLDLAKKRYFGGEVDASVALDENDFADDQDDDVNVDDLEDDDDDDDEDNDEDNDEEINNEEETEDVEIVDNNSGNTVIREAGEGLSEQDQGDQKGGGESGAAPPSGRRVSWAPEVADSSKPRPVSKSNKALLNALVGGIGLASNTAMVGGGEQVRVTSYGNRISNLYTRKPTMKEKKKMVEKRRHDLLIRDFGRNEEAITYADEEELTNEVFSQKRRSFGGRGVAGRRTRSDLPENLRSVMGRATMAFVKADYDEAHHLSESVIAKYTESPDPYQLLGAIADERGDQLNAIRYFSKAAKCYPKSSREQAELWKDLANRCMMMGKHKEALTYITQYTRSVQDDKPMTWLRADLCEEFGDLRGAANSISRYIRHTLDRDSALVEKLQELLLRLRQENRAITILSRPIAESLHRRLRPSMDLLLSLTKQYISLRKYECVIKCCELAETTLQWPTPEEKAASLDKSDTSSISSSTSSSTTSTSTSTTTTTTTTTPPTTTLSTPSSNSSKPFSNAPGTLPDEMMFFCGQAYARLGEEMKAIRILSRQKFSSKEKTAEFHCQLGEEFLLLKHYTGAREMLMKAKDLGMSSTKLCFFMGKALFMLGEYKDAQDWLQGVHDKLPGHADAAFLLADIHQNYADDPATAISILERHLDHLLTHPPRAIHQERRREGVVRNENGRENEEKEGKDSIPVGYTAAIYRAKIALGLLLKQQGNRQRCMQLCEDIVFNDPYLEHLSVEIALQAQEKALEAGGKSVNEREEKERVRRGYGVKMQNFPTSLVKMLDPDTFCDLLYLVCGHCLRQNRRNGEVERLLKIVIGSLSMKPSNMEKLHFLLSCAMHRNGNKEGISTHVRYTNLYNSRGEHQARWHLYSVVAASDDNFQAFTRAVVCKSNRLERSSAAINLLLGHRSIENHRRKPQLALHNYYKTTKQRPDDPLPRLCLAVKYLNSIFSRRQQDKHKVLACALGHFAEYKARRGNEALQEVYYNFGRAFHQLGAKFLAISFYEDVLDLSRKQRAKRESEKKRKLVENAAGQGRRKRTRLESSKEVATEVPSSSRSSQVEEDQTALPADVVQSGSSPVIFQGEFVSNEDLVYEAAHNLSLIYMSHDDMDTAAAIRREFLTI